MQLTPGLGLALAALLVVGGCSGGAAGQATSVPVPPRLTPTQTPAPSVTTSATSPATAATRSSTPGAEPAAVPGSEPGTLVLDGRLLGSLRLGAAPADRAVRLLTVRIGEPDRTGEVERCQGGGATRRTSSWGPLTVVFLDQHDGRGEILRSWQLDTAGSTEGFRLSGLPLRPSFAALRNYPAAQLTTTDDLSVASLSRERLTFRGPRGAARPTSVVGGVAASC